MISYPIIVNYNKKNNKILKKNVRFNLPLYKKYSYLNNIYKFIIN